jgi:hypothetical protein
MAIISRRFPSNVLRIFQRQTRACDNSARFFIPLTCRYVTRYVQYKTEYWGESKFLLSAL